MTLPKPYFQTELGTLYCGDCLEIMPELQETSIDMVFTDPPYGHNNNNGDLISRREAVFQGGNYCGNRDNRPIANDGIEANDLYQASLMKIKRLLTTGACCCCCCGGGGGPDPQFARWSLWMDKILGFKHMVVWDKGPMGMGFHYRRSYEVILISQPKGNGKCNWYDKTKRIENIIRPISGIAPKIIPSAKQHPTEKPPGLAAYFISLHTKRGDIVLDPYAGHGSFLIACERLNRRWIGIEISEEYCEIAKRRLVAETAQLKLFR